MKVQPTIKKELLFFRTRPSVDAAQLGRAAFAGDFVAQVLQVVDADFAFLHGDDAFFPQIAEHAVDDFTGGAAKVGELLVRQRHVDQNAVFFHDAVAVAQTDER